MRLSTSSAAALLPVLGALASDGASSAQSSTPSSIARPSFIPTTISAPFLEQFTDDWQSRWKPSSAKKENGHTSEEEWRYVGTWEVKEPSVFKGIEGDKGLVVKDKAAHHAISSIFSEPIDNKDKTLVVQYEVKLQDGLECGGAYLKLLRDNKELHADEFSNVTPYVIMFGPDRCGATNKVHFIFQHKNPKTGKYEEKHLRSPPPARIVKTTTLYTLIVKPDQTYEIRIDGEKAAGGSLFEDFQPSVNPPKEIEDPNDTKPSDWVDDERIQDPDAKKPEDWDESEPAMIEDEDAVMPADWLENEPRHVPNPDAAKPEDWDDEEDGEWIPASIPNPRCEDVSGCGPWTRPRIANPKFKGRWLAPWIDNPEYKGPWKPRKIANPDYHEDKTPADFEPMGAIGFELWTMQNNILFDNIYIGHSIEDAEALQKETFDVKIEIEKAERDASLPKDLHAENDAAKQDPLFALQSMPEVAGGLAGALALFWLFCSYLLGAFSASSAPRAKAKAVKVQENKEPVVVEEVEEIPVGTTTGAQVGDNVALSRK